jgi:anthranilate synthase
MDTRRDEIDITEDPSGAATVYRTRGGLRVRRVTRRVDGAAALEAHVDALDRARGAVLTSGFEFPGRYTRWDLAFVDPPLSLEVRGRAFEARALNGRGLVLLPAIGRALAAEPQLAGVTLLGDRVRGEIPPGGDDLPEELRSRRPTAMTVVRALRDLFAADEDPHLGLYGAFGYDLVLQFEPLVRHRARSTEARELVLYLPDELLVVDHARGRAFVASYDFACDGASTAGLPREGERVAPAPSAEAIEACDHRPGEYAEAVERAREAFARGDLFEVVLSQVFRERTALPPSTLFRRLREKNPAPYGFLLALGGEHLVGASPEMFVRVSGDRVETCPIAGTTARGRDALEDAQQIRSLLNSEKDEWELTMCTDVDRNDKSRVCLPGSVRVIGRRQVELYSRLIHTVDHVEGRLRPELDALDAFLSHAWAVTVTGAPKRAAMQFIEATERSPRGFYAGAVGVVGFDGSMNTGLTLRTLRLRAGVAEVRAGATLLHASDPEAEERECRLKAAALFDALRAPLEPSPAVTCAVSAPEPRRILLVDHQDSFVHTLAGYLRQSGAEVLTYRAGFSPSLFDRIAPSLVVLSPGPGRPSEFGLSATLEAAIARGLPVFGVCLGLQGVVEHFGGALATLSEPMHGRPSTVRVVGDGALFRGMPASFSVGRYHSLYAARDALPACLRVTAEDEAGVIMAIEHRELPIGAVQFHPESILTPEELGLRMIENALRLDPPGAPARARAA